jgi:hypothetical protein
METSKINISAECQHVCALTHIRGGWKLRVLPNELNQLNQI